MKKQKKLMEDEEEKKEEIVEDTEKNSELQSSEIYGGNTDVDYRSIQTRIAYESEETIHLNKLNDIIDGIFSSSRWAVLNINKKVPKDLIPLIFQDILKELENTEFTMVEKFVAICDYASISYSKAYDSIHMKYKEIIIQEMDSKFGIIEKKRIKKIF
jgi:hypothetical protein